MASDLLQSADVVGGSNPFIHRLPDTLFEEILLLVIWNCRQSHLDVIPRFLKICHHWYHLINNASRLWAIINLTWGLEVVQHHITKSQNAPLDVYSGGLPPFEAIQLIHVELHRCRSLSTVVTGEEYEEMANSLFQHKDLRLLEELRLSGPNYAHMEIRSTMHAPRLRALRIDYPVYPFPRIGICAPVLTELHIKAGGITGDVHNIYLDLLGQCPELEDVRLIGPIGQPHVPCHVSIGSSPSSRVHLNKLRVLRFQNTPTPMVIAVLAAIQAPNCSNLSIIFPQFFDVSILPSNSVLPSVLRSCKLLKLSQGNASGGMINIGPHHKFGMDALEADIRIWPISTEAYVLPVLEMIGMDRILGLSCHGTMIPLLKREEDLGTFVNLRLLSVTMDTKDTFPLLRWLGSKSSSGRWPFPRLTILTMMDPVCIKADLSEFARGRFAVGPAPITFNYLFTMPLHFSPTGPNGETGRELQAEFDSQSSRSHFYIGDIFSGRGYGTLHDPFGGFLDLSSLIQSDTA
ncbi:hypothetical protein FRC03_003720 [Tulasnella sp. 419]|nr:hypothetical protein FRC02_010111 [Tulasnella sp. 418]KAG8962820.1 hypothetical protein FRC03_003720 [Tulasnella sp. 419]